MIKLAPRGKEFLAYAREQLRRVDLVAECAAAVRWVPQREGEWRGSDDGRKAVAKAWRDTFYHALVPREKGQGSGGGGSGSGAQ